MSVPGECYLMRRGVCFRNVHLSTDDMKYQNMSWMRLWRDRTSTSVWANVVCCACGQTNATVGGHIVLGDGMREGDASIEAKDLKGGNRVFIAPICSGCNGNHSCFCSAYDVKILHLIAFYESERGDHEGLAADFFEEEDAEDRVEEFNKLIRRSDRYQEERIASKRKEDLCQYDFATLNNAPISQSGRVSIPVKRYGF